MKKARIFGRRREEIQSDYREREKKVVMGMRKMVAGWMNPVKQNLPVETKVENIGAVDSTA